MLGIVRESLAGTSRRLRMVCAALLLRIGLRSCLLLLCPRGVDIAWWLKHVAICLSPASCGERERCVWRECS